MTPNKTKSILELASCYSLEFMIACNLVRDGMNEIKFQKFCKEYCSLLPGPLINNIQNHIRDFDIGYKRIEDYPSFKGLYEALY